MDRQKNWYSVVQYVPNTIRGETLNVGLMLHSPEGGKLRYQLLDVNNVKLKSLLSNDVLTETYRVQKDYFNFLLDSLPTEGTLFESGKYSNEFLETLNSKLPNEFRITEPTYSKTNDPDKMFQVLLENYIGKEFLSNNDEILKLSTKTYVKSYFEEKHLIGTKIKSNVKFKPRKDINSMQFIIDFVYKNGVINLLQTAPSKPDRLNDWFTKLLTIIDTTQIDSGFYIFYNKNEIQNTDTTLQDMLHYLKSKDNRVINLEIHSNEFLQLRSKIEAEGKSVEEFENELAV